VQSKRAHIQVYIHSNRRENVVWFDSVALSTGYIGPLAADGDEAAAKTPEVP
jgi:hypothetical protein